MNDIEKISLKFDIDKKIDLNFDNNNKLKVLMLKGDDGFNPYIISARNGKTTTVTVTDYYGTQSFDIYDGVDPTVNVIRDGNKNTLTITDANGTRTTDIYDGVDLTGGVPTDGVIGWDNKDISYTCDGTESGDYYLTYNSIDYYFTMPTIEAGDTLLFNTVDLTLKLNGTTISTTSSGTGTELTFVEYIPNGYETTTELQEKLVSGNNIKTINNTSILGDGNISIDGANVHDSYSTSTTDPYSANYVNGIIESGSNTNGYYEKFNSGLLICHATIGSITTAAGTGTDTQITLPYSFKDGSYQTNVEIVDGQAFWGDIQVSSGSKTVSSFTLTVWNNGGGSNTNQYFNYIAIGRWK